MEQFLLNFNHFPLPATGGPTAEEFDAVNQQWQAFIGGIAHQGLFVGTQRLAQEGKVLHADGTVANAVNEGQGLVVGNLTLKANSLEHAIELAKACPVLAMGGSVEVRPITPFEI